MDDEKIKEQLIEHEGLKLKAYLCPSGRWTIGVGRNLQDKGITEQEAILLLDNDIRECVEGVRQLVPNFEDLGDVRQRVLVDMRFNLGQNGFAGFRKMRAAIAQGDFEQAAEEMLDSKWAEQVGHRTERLADMMREGG